MHPLSQLCGLFEHLPFPTAVPSGACWCRQVGPGRSAADKPGGLNPLMTLARCTHGQSPRADSGHSRSRRRSTRHLSSLPTALSTALRRGIGDNPPPAVPARSGAVVCVRLRDRSAAEPGKDGIDAANAEKERLHLANVHLESGRGDSERRRAQMMKIEGASRGLRAPPLAGGHQLRRGISRAAALACGVSGPLVEDAPRGGGPHLFTATTTPWPIATASGSSRADAWTAFCCDPRGSHRWGWSWWASSPIWPQAARPWTTTGCWRC
jgi:hypothetical protein